MVRSATRRSPAASTPISVPDAGTPLPADGGDAGKSYLAYSTALRKGDVDAIARTMEKERAEAMLAHRKDPDFKQMLGFLQMSAPKEIQIKGGSVKGGHATLDVQGKDADGNEIKGKVRMLKDGNDWRIGEEHLVTVLH
jgi:hypothetical protein